MLRAGLHAFNRRGVLVLAIGVFAGLALPELAAACRPLLPAAVAGLLFLALLRVDWVELGLHFSRPGLNAVLAAWLLLASPLLIWLAVSALGVDAGLATALVLMAACPPIISGPAMALLLGLNAPLILVMVVVATLAAPFTLLLVSASFTDLVLELAPSTLSLRLGALIGGCFVMALLVRRALGRERLARWREPLDGASLVLLLLFAVAIMHGVADLVVSDAPGVLRLVLAAFAANVALQLAGIPVALARGRQASLTVAYATGNRNMGLLLAVLPGEVPGETLVFFALAQFPIYILPALLEPFYRKWLRAV
ncbi:MAG: hypothetical protein R3286_13510 [Gammaproteobacteria bacterium]|nr:hypothetical protein [Gammaproteobacteria bacterium]